MPIDREFLEEMEQYYLESEPEFQLTSQKLGALQGEGRKTHQTAAVSLEQARERFLRKLDYLRRFEALEEHLTHATRHELMKSWLEYHARLSELSLDLLKAS